MADDHSHPLTADGTPDWDAVFEDPKTGIIPLIAQAHTPEVLQQCAAVIIQKLFVRKDEGPNLRKFTLALRTIVPDDADPAELDAMRDGVKELLLRIKEERKENAAAPPTREEARENRKQRAAAARRRAKTRAEDRKARSRKRLVIAIVVTVLVVGTAIPVFLFGGGPDNSAEGKAAVEWTRRYLAQHPPNAAWRVVSVEMAKDSAIVLDVLITDPKHISIIKAASPMSRLGILETVCPPGDSGVMAFIDHGWRLWVNLKSPSEILTGGTCRYKSD